MKYLFFCFAIVTACKAARLPRITDQGYFQNFQGAFPNNDASGYHNVQGGGAGAGFFGDYRGQEGNVGLGSEFYPNPASFGSRQDPSHFAGVPFGDGGANFRPQNYGHLSNDYNFPAQRFY